MVWRGFASTAASKTLSETDLVRLQAGGVHYGGLSSFAAKFLEHEQILALTGDYARWSATFQQVYYMRLGWPKPPGEIGSCATLTLSMCARSEPAGGLLL